jgi:hypothetical protein
MSEQPEFPAWWTDEMKAQWSSSSNRRSDSYPACCQWARSVFCVCVISYMCPRHGTKCYGSHD